MVSISPENNDQIRQWLDEENLDCDPLDGSDYDGEENNLELSEHDMDTEQETDSEPEFLSSEEQINQDKRQKINFYGTKDSLKWYKEPLIANSHTRSHNIIPPLQLPGLQGPARNPVITQLQCLDCFLDESIIQEYYSTNLYIEEVKNNFQRSRGAKHNDAFEIRTLLGIFYLSGLLKAGQRNISELWDIKLGTQLLENKTTYVGTVKRNKRNVPEELKVSKNKDIYSSEFAFTKFITYRKKARLFQCCPHYMRKGKLTKTQGRKRNLHL